MTYHINVGKRQKKNYGIILKISNVRGVMVEIRALHCPEMPLGSEKSKVPDLLLAETKAYSSCPTEGCVCV